jgi:hypothetical protein
LVAVVYGQAKEDPLVGHGLWSPAYLADAPLLKEHLLVALKTESVTEQGLSAISLGIKLNFAHSIHPVSFPNCFRITLLSTMSCLTNEVFVDCFPRS